MTICDDAVNQILDMVPYRESDEHGGWRVLRFDDDAVATIMCMEPNPETIVREGEDVLGTYTPMASPGIITLHWQRIGSLFWHTILEVQRAGLPVEQRDLNLLAPLTVNKTYHHERFHFFCDVARQLFGTQVENLREEALAVAWSHDVIMANRLQWNSSAGRLGQGLFRAFMQRIFHYTALGYCGWHAFESRYNLEQGIADYLVLPQTLHDLTRCGIDAAPLVLGMQACLKGGVIEQLTP